MVVELHPSAYDGQSPEEEIQPIARDMLVRFMRDQWHWEDEGMEISEVIVAHPVVKPRNAFQVGLGELWCSRF